MSVGMQILLVACGGALGALCRVGTGALMTGWFERGWLGTLVANLLGCALMGLLKGVVEAHQWGSEEVRIFVLGGFLGAFTTFSTFMADGAAFWRDEKVVQGVAYMSASVIGGGLCFVVGWWLATRTWGGAV